MYGRIALLSLVVGLVVGVPVGYVLHPKSSAQSFAAVSAPAALVSADAYVVGVVRDDMGFFVLLSDGRMERASSFKTDASGSVYRVGNAWYGEKKNAS